METNKQKDYRYYHTITVRTNFVMDNISHAWLMCSIY